VVSRKLAANSDANVVVLGDFNDTYNTKAIKEIVGRGKDKLLDTRPAERKATTSPNPTNPHFLPRNMTWTHYYGVEDTYSRIDYLMVSPGMAREWVKEQTFIPRSRTGTRVRSSPAVGDLRGGEQMTRHFFANMNRLITIDRRNPLQPDGDSYFSNASACFRVTSLWPPNIRASFRHARFR